MTFPTATVDVSEFSVQQVRDAVISGSFRDHTGLLTRLYKLVSEHQRNAAALEQIAETVGNHLFPPSHKADPQTLAAVLHALGKASLTEVAIRYLVDGWCEHVLFTLLSSRPHREVVDFAYEFRSLTPMFSPLLRNPACPVAVIGRFLRQMKNLPGFETEVKDFFWGVATARSTPPVLALALMKEAQVGDWVFHTSSLAAYKTAQTLYPDIADLPAELFLNVVISQGVPEEWFAEQHLDKVVGRWVAPGQPLTEMV